MGAGESKHADDQPHVVEIDRSDVPDAYKRVGVSDRVVERVHGVEPDGDGRLKAVTQELEKERQANAQLREKMQQLTSLQQRHAGGQKSFAGETLEDLEAKKQVFDATVERVEKQFFNYQRENACADNEQELLACLEKNKGKALNCQSLTKSYDECIAKFRAEVLAAKAS